VAHVFVSYRSPDVTEATALAREIRAAGHDVWLDKWEIAVGDSIVVEIDRGLAAARYVVLCYSSTGNDTPWQSREWRPTLARQLNGVPVKILPVRISGGGPPPILADIRYADLVRDWNEGIRELLAAIR
jgi:hypothetical protein